ncbi:MAG: T9SS type A sorting domain-containing protein [Bacteroidota bacterium]
MKSNKIYIIVFLLFWLSESSFSQWTFVGGPQGVYSNDMIFTRSGRLISSTWQQGVFISDDFGSTWQNKNIYPAFGGVFSLTERANGEIIAVARQGIIVSRDSGQTWSMVFQRYGLNDYGVRVWESPIDSSLYYGADQQLFKSTDGGVNWVEVWRGSFIDSYAVDDSGRVYVGARYGLLLRSTNGGTSFEPFSIGYPLTNAQITHILPTHQGGLYIKLFLYPDWILHFEQNQVTQVSTGYPLSVTENGDLIYKAGNCIARYNHLTKQSSILSCPYFVKDQFQRKVSVLGNVFVANFSSEGLHRSTDAGQTWTDINSGHGYKQVLSIEITQQGKIFASGFGDAFWGGLYKSLDDGTTWSRVQPQTVDAYFIDISTLKNGNLIANGSYGAYLADPEGTQWTARAGITLAYSQYVSSTGAVFVGNDDWNNPGIMISLDNGNSWAPSRNGIQHSYFFGFGEGCRGRIFAAAWPSGTYCSDNQGASWTYVSSDPLSFERAYDFKCRNDTVLAGTSSGIIYSTDNGATWSRFTGLYGPVNRIVVASNGDILAAVYQRGVYRSTTGGRTWEQYIDGMGNRTVFELAFDRIGRLFAATDSGIFRSDSFRLRPSIVFPPNGATNQPAVINLQWNRVPSAQRYFLQVSTDSLFSQLLVSDSTLVDTIRTMSFAYLTTYYWRIAAVFPYGGLSFSDVHSFKTSAPSVFALGQNYPNPFNTETVIPFDVPSTSTVTIRVYNTLGQIVATIVNQEFEPGSHRYTWNATGCASGVYFIRLQSGRFLQTRKALLLR